MQSTLPQNNQHKSRSGGLVQLIILALLIAAAILLWQNYQRILDWFVYSQYKPTAAVAAVADNSGMTTEGKFDFYASQPAIDGTSTFNDECDRKEQNADILGCYVGGKIYIFDVKDRQLNGIKEVTATHEMLHAVYARMSNVERDHIDTLLEVEYEKLKSDPNFAKRMAFYARTEPGERDNELHSIIGVEVSNISQELEAHYAKYFSRYKILAYYNGYESIFSQLLENANVIKKQLDSLSAQIDAKSEEYSNHVATLDSDISKFNSKASSDGFNSKSDFEAERQALINRVVGVKAERVAINKLIDKYNALRLQYNTLVTQQNNLQKSIDSTLAPAPSV